MNYQEAIKILGQYDVSNIHFYTTDGEEIPFMEWSDAIELAISALQAHVLQPTCNTLATDNISRQRALALADTLIHDLPDDERIADIVMARNEGILEYQTKLSLMPPEHPTLYGYKIEHLSVIAEVLQKEGLPPDRVVEALTDIGRIISIVVGEFEESLRRSTQPDLSGYSDKLWRLAYERGKADAERITDEKDRTTHS